jgi:hypothetical protein
MTPNQIPKADAEFAEQCRRQMERPIEERIRYGFCRMYKPVLDDAPYRVFDTMAEYRKWCAENLPDYLGFKPATPSNGKIE